MGWSDFFNAGLSAVGTGLGLYQGQQALSTSEDHYEILAGSAQKQDKIASDQHEFWEENWKPVEQKQAGQALDYYDRMTPALLDQVWENQQFRLDQSEKYRPLENALIADASRPKQDYIDQLVGMVEGDVAAGFDKSAQIMNRNLTRIGVDPGSGRQLTEVNRNAMNRALTEVIGKHNARMTGEDKWRNVTSSALNYNSGVPLPQTPTNTGQQSLNTALQGMANSAEITSNLATTAAESAGAGMYSGMQALNNLTKTDWQKTFDFT